MKAQTRKDLANAQEIIEQRLFEVFSATSSLTRTKHVVILAVALAVVFSLKKVT